MKHNKDVFIVCISITLAFASCAPSPTSEKREPLTAILGAFGREVDMLEEMLRDGNEQRIEGIRFVTGKLKDKSVVVVWTGIGKVNAAMTTTLLIEHFRPEEVIFTGIAGGINPKLSPGDIVIAAETAHHDMGILTPEGFYNRGPMNPIDGWRSPVFLPADKRLIELAEEAGRRVQLTKIRTSAGERSPKIIKGIVVTGDVFVASPAKCAELRERLQADAVEMEGAAVAQICYQQRVPHVVIRSISDKADEKAREDSMVFQQMAAKNSASLILEMIKLLNAELSIEKNKKSD